MSATGGTAGAAAADTRAPLLEVIDVTAGYGALAAVRNIDITVHPGEVVVILGPNGAGKTTILLTVAGELRPFGGRIRLEGADAKGGLHRRAKGGLGYVGEERGIFRQLTVQENLALGPGGVDAALELAPELAPIRRRRAGLLSGGEQQILTLARALAAQPRLLLADELSLGLAPMMAERMLQFVRRAADSGLGVLLVEQQAARALAVADRAYVLRRGRVELAGTASELSGQLGRISELYLGAAPVGASGPTASTQTANKHGY